MSGSDSGRRWPQRERRGSADRRSGANRRTNTANVITTTDEERRQGSRRSGSERRDERGWEAVPLEPGEEQPFSPEEGLLAAARAAREFAQAAYSTFKVGAALETADGTIVTGCNIENATYGLTICAERVAMFKALSDGHRTFRRIAIVADTAAPTPPCGACRQILWEFGGNLEIQLANLKDVQGTHELKALLPLPFDARLLERRTL